MVWVLLAASMAGASASESIESIETRPGITQRFLLVTPAEWRQVTAVVLFPGCAGYLGLAAGRLERMRGNFLLRARARE